MAELYNYRFRILDADRNVYRLRQEMLSSCLIRYRQKGTVDSFTEVTDFNIDEETDSIWVRLPGIGQAELVLNIVVQPLRCVTTSLITLDLVPYSTSFDVLGTPVPVRSLQGFSPRIIDGFWYMFNDELQAFENTGVKAESTVVTQGTVVDVIEPNNPNAISSQGVYNFYLAWQNQNNAYNIRFESLERRLQNIETRDYRIRLNGNLYSADPFGTIDLGEIGGGSGAPATRMLTKNETINGVIYPKGTEVDNEGNVYATDPLYRYHFDNVVKSEDTAYKALVQLYEGCTITVSWRVYNTKQSGVIYAVGVGNEWRFCCTNKEVASTFKFYQRYGWEHPVMMIRGIYDTRGYVTNIDITCDKQCTIYDRDWLKTTEDKSIKQIYPFLTQVSPDTIDIDTNNFSVSPDEMLITNYIVTVGGQVNYYVTEEMETAQNFEFAITQDNTTITWSDGVTTSVSEVCQPGDTIEFIYAGENNYYWNRTEGSATKVRDVKIDGESVVAAEVAYISSLTQAEVNQLKAIFAIE